MVHRIGMLLTFVLATACGATGAADEYLDAQFLDVLRARRLFDLAIAYCQRELEDPALSARRQAALTTEAMRTRTAEAYHVAPDRRAARFADAHRIAADFKRQHQQHRRKVLVDVQDGLVYLAQANLIRQELEAGVPTTTGREEALEATRRAIAAFEAVDGFLEKEIPLRYRSEPGPDDLTADQLLALRSRVKHLRAQSLQCRALLYDQSDRLNRIDALTQVIRQYEELTSTVPRENSLWWEATTDRVRCLRLMNRLTEAAAVVRQIPAEVPNQELGGRLEAERVLLELAEGEPTKALQRALAWANAGNPPSAELEFAALRCMVRLTEDARESADRQAQWQKQAVAQTQRIEDSFGPYWGRRSSRLLVATATGDSPRAANFDVLMRVAEDAFRKGELGEAVNAYEQAAAVALENQQATAWFEAGRKAGFVWQQLKDHQAAANWLRDVATGAPKLNEAPATHLQAAWNLSRLAQADPEQLPAYAEVLEEMISTWPTTAEADQARLWLGRLLEYQGDFRTAFNYLLDCNAESELLAEAVTHALRCAERLCQAEKAQGNDITGVATALAERFEQGITAEDPQSWNAASALAAIASARLRVMYGGGTDERAIELLESIDRVAEDQLDAAWRREATGLLIVSVARLPERRQQLSELIARLQGSSPEQLLSVATAMENLVESSAGSTRESLARAVLPIVKQIESASADLSARQLQQVARMAARLTAAAGDLTGAIGAYRDLIRQSPRDGVLIEELARLLTDAKQSEYDEEALALWRQLARGSQPQSDRWFRAKYQVALQLVRLEKAEDANRLLRFLKETPPGWEGSSLQDDFERLLQQTQGRD